jgi:hypothetical protein
MTSQRKRRLQLNQRTELSLSRRSVSALEDEAWDRMPAVGREFGSPYFDRLMEEDFRLGLGIFDPALRASVSKGRPGLLTEKSAVPKTLDNSAPDVVLRNFEGGAEPEVPQDLPPQPRAPL